jgi:amino acid transporter
MNELTVGDGFKFGCGFFIAGFITWLVIVISMVLFSVLFSTALVGLFEGFDFSSQLLPLLALV